MSKEAHDQANKFREAASELGCDDSEEVFDESLKKVAKAKPKEPPDKRQDKPKGKKPGQ